MAVVSNVHKPIQRVKQNEETKEYIRSQGTQGGKKILNEKRCYLLGIGKTKVNKPLNFNDLKK